MPIKTIKSNRLSLRGLKPGGVLGLDVGATTGFAYLTPDGDPSLLGIIKLTSKAKGFKKLNEAFKALGHIMTFTDPLFVVIEGSLSVNKGFAGQLSKMALHGAYRMVLEHYEDCSIEVVYPSSLKKYIAGHGHAKKHELSSALKRVWPGIEFFTEDVSDALALAVWGAQEKLGLSIMKG